MGKQVAMLVLAALASLQVSQAMGLDKMPFPDWLDEESDNPLNTLIPLYQSWNISTQWLEALRTSYSQLLRYESRDTLGRITRFANNVETGADKYKNEMETIVADTDNPRYSMCVEDNPLDSLQQEVSTAERQLQGCTTPLKALRDKYGRTLDTFTAEVDSRSEKTIYMACEPARYTVTLVNRARKCFYANLQAALSGFYYTTGTNILRTVTEYRGSIAQARDAAYACAEAALSPAAAQRIAGAVTAARRCLEDAPRERSKRGFGKKFKKFLKKAKKGIKKVCSKIPCKVGYSTTFG